MQNKLLLLLFVSSLTHCALKQQLSPRQTFATSGEITTMNKDTISPHLGYSIFDNGQCFCAGTPTSSDNEEEFELKKEKKIIQKFQHGVVKQKLYKDNFEILTMYRDNESKFIARVETTREFHQQHADVLNTLVICLYPYTRYCSEQQKFVHTAAYQSQEDDNKFVFKCAGGRWELDYSQKQEMTAIIKRILGEVRVGNGICRQRPRTDFVRKRERTTQESAQHRANQEYVRTEDDKCRHVEVTDN